MPLFHHPYVKGVVNTAHRVLPLACVGAFLGIVWLDLGAGLNVPALVWHDDPWLQMSAGFSIASLFAYIWLVTYSLDARYSPEFIQQAVQRPKRGIAFRTISLVLPRLKDMEGYDPVAIEFREGGDGLRWYLGATFFPCAIALLLPTLFVVDGSKPFVHITDEFSTPPGRLFVAERWPFAVGVLLTFVGVRVVAGIGNLFRQRMLSTTGRREYLHRYWLMSIAISLFVLLVLLYGLLWWLVDQDRWHPPPVTAVCILCGLLVGITGAVWFHLRILAVPMLIGLVAWLTYCNMPEFKLRFPHMEPEYAAAVDLEDFEEPALSLKEVEPDDNEDRATAEREEAERVCRIVAAIQSQRDPSKSVESRYQELVGRGMSNPANYERLLRQHDIELRLLERDESNALRSWRDQFKDTAQAQRPKLVLLTATGGANRSGLWTSKVLFELHNDPGLVGFSKHLRLITGASGGMVGAAYYVGSVQENGTLQEGFRPEDIAQDFLTPIINSQVFREVPFLAVPCDYYSRDRGEMLDLGMEGHVPRIDPGVKQRLNNVFSRSFADLAPGERAGWRPSMIFSPMIVEDGRRLLISNRHVPFLTVNKGDFLLPNRATFGEEQGSTRLASAQKKTRSSKRVKAGDDKQDVYSRSAVEFFRLFPEARDRFHVSTAARMNATFPFVSPAVSLPTNPPRRVVDAGYFDNTGVSISSSWLYQNREWVAKSCSGIVIIQVRDFSSHRENRHLSLPASVGGSYLPGLTGPLSAIDHARSASANYRNDDELRKLSEYFRSYFVSSPMDAPPQGTDGFFTTVVFERYTEVGMNWYLSASDKRDILDSWDKGEQNMNPASLQKLREWWKKH